MASASSSFTGTESPLSEGGVWTNTSTFWNTLRKATGVGIVNTGADSARRYNPASLTFAADHYSEITLNSVPSGGLLYFHYVMARMNATAGCYLVTTAADIGANIIQLYAISNAGAFNQVGADITLGANFAANDVMRIECVGTTITVKFNGVTVRTVTDSTFTTGQPGLGGWAQNSSSNVIFTKSWAAADLVNPLDDAGLSVPRPALISAARWQPGAALDDDLPTSAAPTMIDDDGVAVTQLLALAWFSLPRSQDTEALPVAAASIVDDEVAPSTVPRTERWIAARLSDDGADLPSAAGPTMIDEDGFVVRSSSLPWARGTVAIGDELPPSSIFPLSVEANGRYLKQSDGTPFLLCADTTWSLFVDLPLAGVSAYFGTLVSQGFNAVMGNAIEHHYTVVKPPKERGGLLPFTQKMDGTSYTGTPNGTTGAAGTQGQFSSDAYSNINNQSPDPTFINNSYWLAVEQILDAALANNLAVLVWPGYLGFHNNDEGWLNEMVVWDAVTGAGGFTGQSFADPSKSKMWNYGAWMAARWKNYPHLIWVMGGDYGSNGQTLNTAQAAAVSNLMAGLKSVAGQLSTLFSAHWDRPALSTDTSVAAGSFDLNGCYADEAVAELARRGYAVSPARPTIGLEYFYEDDLFGGSTPFRKYVYWQFLGGVAGGFYGHEQLWRFDDGSPGTDYTTLLATQARLDAVRQFAFWKSKPWHRLIPSGLGGMGTLITAGGGTASPQSTTYVAAACTPQGDLLLAYVPPAHTGSITVDMSKLTGPITANWFDPTDSSLTAIGSFANTGTHAFTPPANNNAGDTDFLLVLETDGAVAIEEIPPVQLPIAGDSRNNNLWWKPWFPYDADDLPIPGAPPTTAIDDHEDVVGLLLLPRPVQWLPGARAALDDDSPSVTAIEDEAPAVAVPQLQPWTARALVLDDEIPVTVATLDDDFAITLRVPGAPWVLAQVLVDDDLPSAPSPTMVDDQASTAPPLAQLSWYAAARAQDAEDFPADAVQLEDESPWQTSTQQSTGWCAILRQYADDDLPPPAVLEEPGWTFGTGWTVPNLQPPPPDAEDLPIAGPPGAVIDEDPSWPVTAWPLVWNLRAPMLDDDIGGIDFGPAAGHVRITGVAPDLEVYDGPVPGNEIYDGPVPGSSVL